MCNAPKHKQQPAQVQHNHRTLHKVQAMLGPSPVWRLAVENFAQHKTSKRLWPQPAAARPVNNHALFVEQRPTKMECQHQCAACWMLRWQCRCGACVGRSHLLHTCTTPDPVDCSGRRCAATTGVVDDAACRLMMQPARAASRRHALVKERGRRSHMS